MEFRESNRGRWVIALGVIMAVLAGGAAFFLINQAQQQAGQATAQRVPAVVAIQTIPARETIKASDVEVRMVPIDPTNANGVVSDPAQAVGRIPAVSILQGQLITTNMLASTTEGGEFSILGPDESVTPESEAWRAVSLTVPDDSAVGGLLKPGQSVDVFVTAIVNVPADLVSNGRFYPDRSTKITYQDMVILARKDAFYVVRAPLAIAEEIAHLQATGNATFSLALRPDQDTRSIDARGLGETTNRIIQKYGLPVPEAYPIGRGPIQTPVPTASPPPPAPTEAPAPSSSASPAP
jgi:Flp pilus assembly protein CpaB